MVAPGEVIGVYQLDRLLGAGSTSKVFLGTHTLLGRQAAIKVLAPELVSNADVVSRLLTEARVVNDIRHPNIIDIIDFVVIEKPRRVALVMELIEGPSLMTLRGFDFTHERALGLALQIVDAVLAAHNAGVIHRDIKPDNLLLTEDPREMKGIPNLKVVDFGIAKLAGKSGRTATGMMLGTPAYMAPEQVAGRPPPSPASDVFAIGEVLYELLSGQRAYPSSTIHETVRAKLRGELPPLALPENTPNADAFMDLIVQCLQRRPEDRPKVEDVKKTLIDLFPTNWRPSTSLAERLIANAVSTGRHPIPSIDLPPQETELAPMVLGDDTVPPKKMSVLPKPSVEETGDPVPPKVAVTQPHRLRPDEITDRSADEDDEDASTQLSFDDPMNPVTLPPAVETELAQGAGIRPRKPSVPTNKTMEALLDGETVEQDDDDDDGAATAVTMLGADALMSPAGVDPVDPITKPTADAIRDEERPGSKITRELELGADQSEDKGHVDKGPTKEMEAADPAAVVESGDVQSDPARNHHPPSMILGRARGTTAAKPKSKTVWYVVGALWLVAMLLVAAIVLFPRFREAPKEAPPPPPPPPTQAPAVTGPGERAPVTIRTEPAGAQVRDKATGRDLGRTPLTLDATELEKVQQVSVSSDGKRTVDVDLSNARGTVWVEIN